MVMSMVPAPWRSARLRHIRGFGVAECMFVARKLKHDVALGSVAALDDLALAAAHDGFAFELVEGDLRLGDVLPPFFRVRHDGVRDDISLRHVVRPFVV